MVTTMPTKNDLDQTILELREASLSFGDRSLWQELNFSLKAGEFLAVLGPNGAGKSSLLKVLLGLQGLSAGRLEVDQQIRLGYVPQQKSFDADLPLRGRDLVRFGLDGKKWGISKLNTGQKERLDQVIAEVGASDYADQPIGLLSGGEQQRLRIAQALVNDPQILLCDEPLLSLDFASQQKVSSLIDERRKSGAAVVFVTHEINPILPLVDRVLYLVEGRWAIGKPAEVLNSKRLSELYGTHIDVLQLHGRIIVVNVGGPLLTEPGGGHHHVKQPTEGES